MVEVGTTNRTHPHDYERAIGERTALLMKVHTSNYAVQGFTVVGGRGDAGARSRTRKACRWRPTSAAGSLVDLAAYGLPREPLPQEMLAAGCDVVTFSGDKLLGGPQAGLIVGTKAAVERIRRFPMKRALRITKLPLAALEATLHALPAPRAAGAGPADAAPADTAGRRDPRAARCRSRRRSPVRSRRASRSSVVDLMGQIGSGSLPVERLPSAGLALALPAGSRRGAGARSTRWPARCARCPCR